MIGNEFERLRFNALMNKKVESPSTGGYLYGWGTNSNGQLGLGYESDYVLFPTFITEFNTLETRNTGTHYQMPVYVIDGKLYVVGWIRNYYKLEIPEGKYSEIIQLNEWDDWEQVQYGNNFYVGLRAGKLYSWGDNSDGKTGQGTTSRYTTKITQIGTDEDWVDVSVGHYCTIAKKSNGEVWGWGDSINYQLNTYISPNPNPIRIPDIDNYDKLTTGFQDNFIIKDGKLYGWGSNSRNCLGLPDGKKFVTRIGNDNDWEWIYNNSHLSAGIRNGEIYMFGDFRYVNDTYNKVPTKMNIGNDWSKVYVSGSGSMFAIKNNGTLWCMGVNSSYELGLGHKIDQKGILNQIGTDNDWIDIKSVGRTVLATKASKITP